MTDSSHPHAREFLDRVLDTEHGLKAIFTRKEDAIRFRHSCYQARDGRRRRSKRIFKFDDPGYDRTDWDEITISIIEESNGRWSAWARVPTLEEMEIVEVQGEDHD